MKIATKFLFPPKGCEVRCYFLAFNHIRPKTIIIIIALPSSVNGNEILTHGNVYNKGIINGKDFLESGDITNKFSHIYSDNSGLSLGESTLRSEFSGNGISQIEKIEKNSGIFKGNGYYKSGNVTVIHKNNYDPIKLFLLK